LEMNKFELAKTSDVKKIILGMDVYELSSY
jgi:hypothetical protein